MTGGRTDKHGAACTRTEGRRESPPPVNATAPESASAEPRALPPASPEAREAPSALSELQGWVLAGVALLPALLAVAQLGRIHPDEVYQVLEPGWWRVHGYGVMAWEWQRGLRNWAAPLVVAGCLRLADMLGLTHPVAYRGLIAVPQWALHAWSLSAVYRFSERRAGAAGGWLATLMIGLYGPLLVFAGRTMAESLSASFLLVAMEALDRQDARPARAGLVGGLALGLAVVARYPSGVFVVVALLWLVFARRWRVLAFACLGGAGVAVALGALDAVTWGSPFHSFFAYARFNVLSDGAAATFGAAPPDFYLQPILNSVPVWGWAAVPLGLLGLRRSRALSLPLVCALAYVAILLSTPHKEARFLYPGLVLGLMAAAPRVAEFILARQRQVLRWGLGGLAVVLGTVHAEGFPPDDLRADQFRAIVSATRDGARGLLIVNEGLWGAGGFFYIGKNIPWRTCDWPQDAAFQASIRDPDFNRAVTFEKRALAELQAAGFHVVREVGRETVLARD
ncbi:mannosyltransferase [Corallococcus sp. M34]|nr:mannosyltransferase [Citreicoccus inhibens]